MTNVKGCGTLQIKLAPLYEIMLLKVRYHRHLIEHHDLSILDENLATAEIKSAENILEKLAQISED